MTSTLTDRVSCFRFCLITLVALLLGLSVTGGRWVTLGVLYMVTAAAATGLLLERNAMDWLTTVSVRLPSTILLILVWVAFAGSVLIWGGTSGAWPAWNEELKGLSGGGATVRSWVDIALLAGMLGVGRVVFNSFRRAGNNWSRLGSILFLVLLPYLAWSLKKPARDYLILWADGASAGARFLALFDLGNALWVGAVIPLALIRELSPERTRTALEGSVTQGRFLRPVVLLVLVPPLVGCAINLIVAGSFSFLDVLPTTWYMKKAATLLLWTATYEEVVFRVVCLIGLEVALSGAVSTKPTWLLPAAGSSLLFAVAHSSLGWVAMCGAAIGGMIYAFVFLRTRNIEVCILGHVVWAVLLVPWNQS